MSKQFQDLAAFATEDRIIRLVAKERAKYTAKNGGSPNPFVSDVLYAQIKAMTPPHRLWNNPGRGKLPQRCDHGLARWTCRKKRATARIYRSILKYRHKMPDESWVVNINDFIREIQESLSGNGILKIETPRILAKFKERDVETGDFIYRPICKYSDLKTKIILALAYQYILAKFDRYFHEYMLFMRAPRRAGAKEYIVPKFLDAIDLVSQYRERNGFQNIYVGECDIQKFYDIFNHDVILDAFEDLFEEAKRNDGASDADFNVLRNVLRSYLSSFNYPEHVLGKNGDNEFWKSEIRRRKNDKCPDPVCRFKWVKEEAFVSSGCYTEDEFREVRDAGKLGIPQGGALSGIIVNVVMRMVDKPIVSPDDPGRLFIRYCDDILLMHTDKDKCVDYLDTYYWQLLNYKLIPHPRKDVSEFKSGARTKSGFWHCKSKNVYLWGSGEGSASDWVAFVGYEMRRTGEIRVRKDKIDAEFKRIAKRYYDIIYSRLVTSGEVLSEEQQDKLMQRMDDLSAHILDYEKAGNNVFTRSQARRLDKYLYRKSLQAAKRIGIADSEDAAKQRTTYRSRLS
ncbi:MAG: reverse transcriptase domain-containing protein [Candidatus Cryptobacteroides sp.]